jgi:periplasmic protein TonB
MVARVDNLEHRESLNMPLMLSVAVHGGLFSLIALYTSLGQYGRVLWGNPHSLGGGGSVGIQAVKQLPMPARTGAVNPVANDTESRVPQPPKPEVKKPQAPDPEAIPLRGHEAPRKATYMRSQQSSQYNGGQERQNQLYSEKGQALSSNMFGGLQGTGGVGMGPGSAFGNRFGWYRDLLEQRVAQKWHTDEVDPRLQTAPPVIVTFEIRKNGSLSNVRILQGSGNRTLDYSAQRAIFEAAPFPPLPPGYERDAAQIEFWFQLKR